jgi:hypothetical protein
VRTSLSAVLALGVISSLAMPALAIPIYGESDPTNNSADFNYDRLNALTLQVTLENTSNYSARITGFGFDIYNGAAVWLASVSGTANNDNWDFDFDAIPGPGDRDAFAITGSNLWGGSPNSGIAVNMTGAFDFLGLFADDVAVGNVVVRWQRTGYTREGSDRGYGCVPVCETPPPPTQVPEPSSLTLLGLGLLVSGGVASWRRRRAAR